MSFIFVELEDLDLALRTCAWCARELEEGEARAGDDLMFRVCSTRCEKPLKKLAPRALPAQAVSSSIRN